MHCHILMDLKIHQLITVEEEKDLGILFSSTFKVSHYVKEIASAQGQQNVRRF